MQQADRLEAEGGFKRVKICACPHAQESGEPARAAALLEQALQLDPAPPAAFFPTLAASPNGSRTAASRETRLPPPPPPPLSSLQLCPPNGSMTCLPSTTWYCSKTKAGMRKAS